MQLANPGHVLCMLTFFPSSANGMVKQANRGSSAPRDLDFHAKGSVA